MDLQHHERFEDFFEAAKWQKEIVERGFADGLILRNVQMTGEEDFETKIYWWRVYVRFFEVVKEPPEEKMSLDKPWRFA